MKCRKCACSLVLFTLFGTRASFAQTWTPSVQPRAVTAEDPTGEAFWEPVVAAGTNHAISVFHEPTVGVRYAVYDKSQQAWNSTVGTIPGNSGAEDPSIAYDRVEGTFLAVARTGEGVFTSHFIYNASSPNGVGEFETWEEISEPLPSGKTGYDKCWLAAGEQFTLNNQSKQEFYIISQYDFGAPGRYVYLRSVDGGHTWAQDFIQEPDPANPGQWIVVGGLFGAQHAVVDDGPLYFAYPVQTAGQTGWIYALRGQDVDGDQSDPGFDLTDPADVGVQFERLRMQNGNDLRFRVSHVTLSGVLPGQYLAKQVAHFAIVPGAPGGQYPLDRLVFAYHEVTSLDDPNSADYIDVNVYLRVMTE